VRRWIEVALAAVMVGVVVWLLLPSSVLRPEPRNLAVACGDALLIASIDSRTTSLSLWRPPAFRPLDAIGLGRPVDGLATSRTGESALCWTGRIAYRIDLDRLKAVQVWRAAHPILQLLEVRIPVPQALRVLALCAEDASGEHPLRSHLSLIDPPGAAEPRALSPESGYNFWAASAGDVDGDGAEDLALCTWSQTARDPDYARRLFVYAWDEDGHLHPLWRGSRLSRPYHTARLAQALPGAQMELVSVETGLTGERLLVAYEWNQFGFWGLGHTPECPQAEFVGSADLDGDGAPELVATEAYEGGRRALAFHHAGDRWEPHLASELLDADEIAIVLPAEPLPIVVAYHGRGSPRPRSLDLTAVAKGDEDDA